MIIEIAKAVMKGEIDLESIDGLEPRTAYDRLVEIKGVGHWTANNVIGRALGAYPYVSQNDVALQAAVQHYFHDGAGQKSSELVRDTLCSYGEYAGLVGHFVLLRWVLDRYPPISH
jgi:3-methyladenine DNA glycosylase/8-oxoguanine DNA glycosylase